MFISEDRKRQMRAITIHLTLVSLDKNEYYIYKTHPWIKIKEIKSKLSNDLKIKPEFIRLFHKNTEMINKLSILDYQLIDKKDCIIKFRIADNLKFSSIGYIQIYGGFPSDKKINRLIEEINYGFLQGLIPSPSPEGTSGTYFLKNNEKNIVAVFKPIDEEAFSPNNRKGYIGKFGQQSLRKGILSGEGSIREVAASLIDSYDKKIFKVPDTTFVEIKHNAFISNTLDMMLSVENMTKIKASIIHNFINENIIPECNININKINSNISEFNEHHSNSNNYSEINSILKKKYGSLQKFVHDSEVAANYSNSLFSVDEIHKLIILDFRIVNCDRNDENILVLKKKNVKGEKEYKLIPIDHSLSFPDCIEINEYEMCWMGWNQSKLQFNSKLIEYISQIDPKKDITYLSNILKMRPKCLQNFRIVNILLKIAACEFNLTPYEIGLIIYRPEYLDIQSPLENIIIESKKLTEFYVTSK